MHPRCRSVPLWISNPNHVSLSTCPLPGTLTRTWGPPVQESCLFKSPGTDWHDTWQAGLLFFFFFFLKTLNKFLETVSFFTTLSHMKVSVQSFSCVQLFATPWTEACQAFLSITNSQSLLKFMSINLMMPSNHLNLLSSPFSSCRQSFPASGSFPMSHFFTSGGQSTGVSASASVLPVNIQDWFILGWIGWISLQSKGLSRVFNTTVQKHQFFSTQPSLQSNSHIHSWLLEKP